MAGFLFKLEATDGAPADPPTFESVVPKWRPGDEIPLGSRSLRVVGIKTTAEDEPSVLIVEEV
jgi:hypothetical protein